MPAGAQPPSSSHVSNLFLKEEMHGEARINRIRLFALAVFSLNEQIDFRLGIDDLDFHRRMTVVTACYVAFAVGAWALVNRRKFYREWLKYSAALADALFLTWALREGDGPASPLASMFYLQIAVTGLRFSPWATIAAALFSAASYLFLFRVRPTVPGHVAAIQVLAMLVMGGVAGQVVRQLRGLSARFAETLARRRLLEGALVRYVSRQVADEILRRMDAGEVKLTGERRYVTILFSDIRGFTPIAEKADPVELLAFLNRYFQAMIEVVFEQEGTLDKFIGDAMLVVFGAPLPQQDSELRALRCARRMQQALQEFNEAQRRRGERTVHVGVGIHSGEVVAGDLGSPTRMEYTVLGDVVNLAERLQGQAPGGKILVSKAVREKAPAEFEFRELEPFQVKGREEPVAAFELL